MSRPARWTRARHTDFGEGWRLDHPAAMDVVLAYDPLDAGGATLGGWVLWIDGKPYGVAIDHYLDTAQAYVEAIYLPQEATA